MVPMNLMTGSGKADFVVSGMWAKKAFEEAGKFGDAKQIASSQDKNFSFIPKISAGDVRSDADYLYIAWNNTIYGTQYKAVPQTGGIPIVADMSSCIFSEKINIDDFALIFACAQKMFGPAGLTAVIVRKELLGRAGANTPVYLDYKTHYDGDSLYNTPPTYCIYIAWLTLKHLKEIGGVEVVQKMTERRASRLYSFIDESSLFTIPAVSEDRSFMNALFVTGDGELDKKFIAQADSEGLVNLGGHRSTGGMRASMYNWLPDEAVDKLIDFMYRFEKDNKVK
jgi:phosphoserine aminotransferase